MFRTLWFAVLLVACGSSKTEPAPGVELDSSIEDSSPALESAVDSPEDVAPFPVRRLPCVQRSALSSDLPSGAMGTYGAVEGELVTIVPPGMKGCPSDPDHVHLQIAVGDKRYDVALTVDATTNAPLAIHLDTLPPTLPAPGFDAMAKFDYERDLGTPSADFTALAKDALAAKITDSLKDAARVRIFGITYTDGTGIHFVHRNGRDHDGVLVVHRVEAGGADRAIAIRFANDVF